MEHPDRVIAFAVATFVLVLDAAAVWRLVGVRRQVRPAVGYRLATALLIIGVAVTIGQVVLVTTSGLLIADADGTLNLRVLLFGAAQGLVALSILWATRTLSR